MRAIALILLPTLAGCAPQSTAVMQSPLPAMLAGFAPGAPRSCIPTISQSNGIQLIDDDHAIVRDGRTVWVNQLRAPCDAGNGFRTIVIDVHGGQYCSHDLFRLVDVTSSIPGPACSLGEWIPYTRGR